MNLVHAWMNRYGACLALMPPKPHPGDEEYGMGLNASLSSALLL